MTDRPQPKMLIADDDPAIVKLLTSRCEKMGFAVDTASNGMQMLFKARRAPPDVLIVDVNMPKLDGLTASARLLAPSGSMVDVIVVSGGSQGDAEASSKAMGMYYSHKGPNFWRDVGEALCDIFPSMAGQIMAQTGASVTASDVIPARPRVLLVDDDEQVSVFLTSRLSKYGIDTLYAPNAAQGLKLALRHQPSAIVTDFQMPEGDANFLITRLRSMPETAKIPVIVLSGKTIDDKTVDSLKREVFGHAGAAGIFKKSFDVTELFEALEHFCGFERGGEASGVKAPK